MKRVVPLVVVALVAAACTSSSDGATTTVAPPSSAVATTVAPTTTTTTSAPTTTTTEPPPPTAILDVKDIWAFPGPHQFEGDVVTFQVPLGDFDNHELGRSTLIIDGEPTDAEATLGGDPLLGGYIIFPDAFDTKGAAGTYEVIVEAEIDDTSLRAATTISVADASQRPAQESVATWQTISTDCCEIQYLTESAAARDVEELTALIDASAAAIETQFGVPLPRVDLVLIDVLWGNGGYASSELVVSYLDRDFGPRTADTIGVTFMHEFTHAITRVIENSNVPWPLEEALAVYSTGGHFKPESLPSRAKALLELGRLLPLGEFLDEFPELQHESRYVQAGALTTYLVETYGWDNVLDFYGADVDADTSSSWFDTAATEVFGAGIDVIGDDYAAWVDGQDSTEELRDLELTIALQQARRAYQVSHAPYQNYFVFPSVTEIDQPATALRESRAAPNTATEALIGWGQQLIIEGRYDEAAQVTAQVEEIAATGRIDGGLASHFLEVAEVLAAQGLELLDLDLVAGGALGTATREHPQLLEVTIVSAGGEVTVQSVVPAS